MKYLTLIPVFLLLLLSCKKEVDQTAVDEGIIVKYLEDNNLDATRDPNGVYYIMERQGIGGHPNRNSVVQVKYKGYLLDGTVFDETTTESVSFRLSNLIVGWQIGLSLMQPGGRAKLIIPSGLAYGRSGTSGIPANSIVMFDVTLVDFSY